MSDYSFLKSGFDNVLASDNDNIQENVTTLVATFATEAMRHASHYVEHHKSRDVIMTEDIKRGMMLEVFLFKKRPDLAVKPEEVRKLINEYDDDSDTDDSDDEHDDDISEMDVADSDSDEPVIYSKNTCECGICKCMNTIYDRWDSWVPDTQFDTILKNNIDRIRTSA